VLRQQQVNHKFSIGNDVRSVFPEKFATNFILKVMFPVAQANNIDTVSRDPQMRVRLKISRQI